MKKAFTLIETLTVMTIIAMVIPAIFYIILSLVRQQVKIFRISQVKREGDYLINVIETLVRNNAVAIHSALPINDANLICSAPETSPPESAIYFRDRNDSWFGFVFSGDKVTSDSANLIDPIDLNSTKTIINNFVVNCTKTTDYTSSTVNISFDICYKNSGDVCTSSRPEETATFYYQTRVKLRNF